MRASTEGSAQPEEREVRRLQPRLHRIAPSSPRTARLALTEALRLPARGEHSSLATGPAKPRADPCCGRSSRDPRATRRLIGAAHPHSRLARPAHDLGGTVLRGLRWRARAGAPGSRGTRADHLDRPSSPATRRTPPSPPAARSAPSIVRPDWYRHLQPQPELIAHSCAQTRLLSSTDTMTTPSGKLIGPKQRKVALLGSRSVGASSPRTSEPLRRANHPAPTPGSLARAQASPR